MAAGMLRMPAEPRHVKAAAGGHADQRPDWHDYLRPVLPARALPGARNGLPWRPWHWLDARAADRDRTAAVAAAVTAARARAAARVVTGRGPA